MKQFHKFKNIRALKSFHFKLLNDMVKIKIILQNSKKYINCKLKKNIFIF
jgi:hypothetical protein